MSNTTDNKRIAKNTLLLYARMIYSLAISLYTSRVILAALGFEDYGLYNVIGSAVTMFGFLKSAMGNSVHRYITYSLGKGDNDQLTSVFSMSVMIHTALAILIVLLCESIGIWFLNTHIEIPAGRELAANWVFQFSVLSCAIAIICVPYDALIISHEKMGIFALIQMLNSTFNLVIAFAISHCNSDRLVIYAALLLGIQILNRIGYSWYCKRKFRNIKFRFVKNKQLFKEMTGFAGWSLFGNLAYVANAQGQNIVLNMFFGPVVNAARGIAYQVQGAIKGFVTNFQMALNPQITKNYAKSELNRLYTLIYMSSKMSFCMLWCMALPILMSVNAILQLWLKNVPEHAATFLSLIIITMLFDTLENPLATAISATGKIKKYQVVVGLLRILVLPLSYFALCIQSIPEYVFYVNLGIVIIAHIIRLFFARKLFYLSIRRYVNKVIIPVSLMLIFSTVIAFNINIKVSSDIITLLINSIVYSLIAIVCAYVIVLSKTERSYINGKLLKPFKSRYNSK